VYLKLKSTGIEWRDDSIMRIYSTFQQTGKTGDKTIEKIRYFD
jgi:hypothetical protein